MVYRRGHAMALLLLIGLLGVVAAMPAERSPAPLLQPPWTGRVPAQERHPSLFFAAGDVARLRERVEREPFRSWWATRRGTEDAVSSAFRWLLVGDEGAAAKARDSLLQTPIWREAKHGYIERSSHAFFVTIMAYDFLAAWPGLSADEHQQIRAKLAAEAEYYYAAMTISKGGQNEGNQRTLGASALGLCALALSGYRGSEHTPQQWLDMALAAIRAPGNFGFFRPDGMFIEGHGYTNYMGLILVPFMAAYTRLTGQDLFTEPTLTAWLRYHAYFFLPDNRNVNFGTSNYGVGWSATLYPLVTNRFGGAYAPLYAWVARRTFGGRLHPNLIHAAIGLFDETVPPTAEAFPASAVFPVSEQMVMKDGWADDLTGVWITGKGAGWTPSRYRTYSQGDVTSFVFYSAGQFLAVDAGYPHWRGRDGYGPELHNLVLIDGGGPSGDTLGALEDAVMSLRLDAATITTAYAGHQVQRVFLFAEKRVLLVADFLAGDGEHEYTFQLHSPITVGKAEAIVAPDRVSWPGFDVRVDKVSATTLTARFAGPVAVARIASHWRPRDEIPVENIAIGAKWRGTGATALLSMLSAQQPRQVPIRVQTHRAGGVQRLEARTDDWLITAQASASPAALKDTGAEATARLLVSGSEVRGGKVRAPRWIYVWDASTLKLGGVTVRGRPPIRRGLFLRNGERWTIAPKAEGT